VNQSNPVLGSFRPFKVSHTSEKKYGWNTDYGDETPRCRSGVPEDLMIEKAVEWWKGRPAPEAIALFLDAWAAVRGVGAVNDS
jgi:hypothetical protein